MPRTPKKWTEEEDEILRNAVAGQTHGPYKDWHKIAATLPGRNNKDCRKRWHYRGSGIVRKGPWKLDEDHRLWTGVQKHGNRWALVAHEVETRNGDQCAKRWQDALDPNLDHSDWVEEEDKKLLEAVELHGRNWKTIIEAHFPRRSRLSAKNRYALLERKREIQDQISSLTPQPQDPQNSSSPAVFSSRPTSESVSGCSQSEKDPCIDSPDMWGASSTTSEPIQSGVPDVAIGNCLLAISSENTVDDYPWPLSPAESCVNLSPNRGSPQFAFPRTEGWTANLFDDMELFDENYTHELGIAQTLEPTFASEHSNAIFPFSPAVSSGDDSHAEAQGVAGVNTGKAVELPDQQGRAQKFTISVDSATPETIKSILEILLKTRTQVTINTS